MSRHDLHATQRPAHARAAINATLSDLGPTLTAITRARTWTRVDPAVIAYCHRVAIEQAAGEVQRWLKFAEKGAA